MHKQLVLPIALNDNACFENFWVGQNHQLINALQKSLQLRAFKVVYFYGVAGAGKSHLLLATTRLARQKNIRSSYLSLKDPRLMPEMLQAIDVAGVICVDDLSAWAGNDQAEKALFTLFEQIKHANGQLIVSATQTPLQVKIQLPDLISRLSSGLLYPLIALSDDEQFNAVKMRADYRGLTISDDAVKFLLTRLPRDTAQLFSVLDKIDRASLVKQRRITIPFLQSLFKEALIN